MEVRATYRHARISPYKCRQVTREIQGLSVSNALDILTYTPKKAAHLVGKTLRSAIANAENNHDLISEGLVIKSAVVGQGPAFKRFKARAKGSASPIKKRTSHIYIILSDEIELETREEKPKAPKAKAKKKTAKKATKKATAKKEEASAPKGTTVDEKKGLVYTSKPDQVDDLKEISGVGPVLEEKLHANGIYTYEQISQWKKAQIEEFGELLSFKDRIERDDWVSQAKKLAKETK